LAPVVHVAHRLGALNMAFAVAERVGATLDQRKTLAGGGLEINLENAWRKL